MDLCFSKINKRYRMSDENLEEITESYNQIRYMVMQGGKGEVKHWTFNDPPKREGAYTEDKPSPEEFREQSARAVNLHSMTIIRNARTSGGGVVANIQARALAVGPVETWKSEKVSIWHPNVHFNFYRGGLGSCEAEIHRC